MSLSQRLFRSSRGKNDFSRLFFLNDSKTMKNLCDHFQILIQFAINFDCIILRNKIYPWRSEKAFEAIRKKIVFKRVFISSSANFYLNSRFKAYSGWKWAEKMWFTLVFKAVAWKCAYSNNFSCEIFGQQRCRTKICTRQIQLTTNCSYWNIDLKTDDENIFFFLPEIVTFDSCTRFNIPYRIKKIKTNRKTRLWQDRKDRFFLEVFIVSHRRTRIVHGYFVYVFWEKPLG